MMISVLKSPRCYKCLMSPCVTPRVILPVSDLVERRTTTDRWKVAPVVVAELSLPAASNTLIPNLIPTCDGRALMGRRETNQ